MNIFYYNFVLGFLSVTCVSSFIGLLIIRSKIKKSHTYHEGIHSRLLKLIEDQQNKCEAIQNSLSSTSQAITSLANQIETYQKEFHGRCDHIEQNVPRLIANSEDVVLSQAQDKFAQANIAQWKTIDDVLKNMRHDFDTSLNQRTESFQKEVDRLREEMSQVKTKPQSKEEELLDEVTDITDKLKDHVGKFYKNGSLNLEELTKLFLRK